MRLPETADAEDISPDADLTHNAGKRDMGYRKSSNLTDRAEPFDVPSQEV